MRPKCHATSSSLLFFYLFKVLCMCVCKMFAVRHTSFIHLPKIDPYINTILTLTAIKVWKRFKVTGLYFSHWVMVQADAHKHDIHAQREEVFHGGSIKDRPTHSEWRESTCFRRYKKWLHLLTFFFQEREHTRTYEHISQHKCTGTYAFKSAALSHTQSYPQKKNE